MNFDNARMQNAESPLGEEDYTPPQRIEAAVYDRMIGERVRLARGEAGLSQQDLAEALGLSFQQIQKYEKGQNRISAGRLVQIAALFEQPIAYFYDDIFCEESIALPLSNIPRRKLSREAFEAAHLLNGIENGAVRRKLLKLLKSIRGAA